MNKIEIQGNLGGDPEMREIKGTKLCNFSVATSNDYQSKGEWVKQDPTWHRVSVWGDLAEACAGLKKGQTIRVVGKQEHREHEGKFYATIRAFSVLVPLKKRSMEDAKPPVETKSSDTPF